MEFTINKAFQQLNPPLKKEELVALEESLKKEGCRNPLIVWEREKEGNVLIDGHNRFSICTKNKIKYDVHAMNFNDALDARIWIRENQLGRRNLTNLQRSLQLGELYGDSKRKVGGQTKDQHVLEKEKKQGKTAYVMSEQFKVSPKYIRDCYNLSSALNLIIQNTNSNIGNMIIAETFKVTNSEILKLSKQEVEIQRQVVARLEGKSSPTIAQALKDIDQNEIALVKTAKQEDKKDKQAVFNFVNDSDTWARWTWNPTTGCVGECEFCISRDIADRYYENGFTPIFHKDRLEAPVNTPFPDGAIADDPWYANVLVGNMGDLFDEMILDKQINQVLDVCKANKQWTYVFMTKQSKRLKNFTLPDNCWIGITIHDQKEVKAAETAMLAIKNAAVKFAVCEPLLGPLKFTALTHFDWIQVGGLLRSSNMQPLQPEWEWVESLLMQARKAQKPIYFRNSLTVKPQELPVVKDDIQEFLDEK